MKRILSVLMAVSILLSLAVLPAQAVPATLVGDVDGNGNVEIDDATFLQRHLVNIPLPFYIEAYADDADEDGSVTVLDVTYIQRWLIGMDHHLNIGESVYGYCFEEPVDTSLPDEIEDIFLIDRICPAHFFGYSLISGTIIKINTVLSDQWCLGDKVTVSLKNVRVDINGFFGEGDLVTIEPYIDNPDQYVAYKPVIYLYPEEETDAEVKLDLDGEFTYTYPEYKDDWNVTASPDGTLTDKRGNTYPYLFWDGKLNTEYDFSSGFCVKGGDTEDFLRDKLAVLGLNQTETDDFIDFWLRFMQDNPYNVISFQTSAYTDAAKLSITPQPDTEIRVFMAWYGSETAVDIPEQNLTPAHRSGFTAVEWGGQMIK